MRDVPIPEQEEKYLVYEDQKFLFMKPPYMPFDEQDAVILKLKEAFVQHEFLFMYGYSGCGKSTVIHRFATEYPETVLVFDFFNSLSPTGLIVEIGNRFNIKLKQRVTEIDILCERLKAHPYIMLIFDEVNATRVSKRNLLEKLEILRRIYMSCDISVVICGNLTASRELHNPNNFEEYSAILSRLDEIKMLGMSSVHAQQYFSMLTNSENVRFTYQSQQALIKIATSPSAYGIRGFVTLISRCITRTRALYYINHNINIPEILRVHDNAIRPMGNTIITLPATNDILTIDESMVRLQLSHWTAFYTNAEDKKKRLCDC